MGATVVMGTLVDMTMMAPALLVLVRRFVLVVVAVGAADAMGIVPVQKEPKGQQAALPALSCEQTASVLQQMAVVTIVEQ